MADVIATIIVVCLVGAASFYIYKKKKSGTGCIGCPDSGCCAKAKNGCCHGAKE